MPAAAAILGSSLLVAGLAAPAAAAGFYVSVTGSDANPGTIARPWRTVQASAARLHAGDTLYVRGGTYLERPTVAVSGTAAAPIVIRSYPGEDAVLDSGVPDFRIPGNTDWELVNAALGEWRSVRAYTLDEHVYAYVLGIPGYVNGRVVLNPYKDAAAFRSTSEAYVDGVTPFYVGPGTFWDPTDGRFHIRLAKTADLRATEARYGQIFDSDTPDPRRYSIVLSHVYSTLTVTGAYLVFQDLTVNQALNSVWIKSGAHDLTFDGVTVWLGDSAIESIGASAIRIVNSRIYGDAPHWIFWSDMKDAPAPADLLRSTSIDLRSGTHGVEIDHCHLRGAGQDLVSTGNDESDVRVHHCRIENAGDDAFELEGTVDVGRVEIYENYILNCLTAVAPGQDTPRFTGPVLVYRNVIVTLRNPPVNRREGINTWNGGGRFGNEYLFKHGLGSTYSTRNAHYYQNTLVMLNSGGKGLNLIPKDPTDGRIGNNIAVMINGVVNRDYRAAPGLVVDGNLYWKPHADGSPLLGSFATVPLFSASTGWEAHGLGTVSGQGTDPKFVSWAPAVVDRAAADWELTAASETPAMTDFFLRSDSPARRAAVTLPAHPTLGPLPDTRLSDDLGAIPGDASPAAYQGFPFEPGTFADVVPPSRASLRIRVH